LHDSTKDVKYIACQPNNEEDEGQAIGRAAAEIFNDLGRENDDPTGNGN
jgi:hypothetical protein